MTEEEKDMWIMGQLSDAPDGQLEGEPLEVHTWRAEDDLWKETSFGYWYDGCPEHMDAELNKKFGDRPLKTLIGVGKIPDRFVEVVDEDEQWVRVYTQQLGPERECPSNQMDVDDVAWDKDGNCPFCEVSQKEIEEAEGDGHGMLYVGEEWWEVTYCNEQTQILRWALTEIATVAGELDKADQGVATSLNRGKASSRLERVIDALEAWDPQDHRKHNAEPLKQETRTFTGARRTSASFLRRLFAIVEHFLSWDEIAPKLEETDAKETFYKALTAIEDRAAAKLHAEAREKFNIEAAKKHASPGERMARVAEALSDVPTEGGRYTSSASGGDAAVRSRLLAEELEPKPRNERRRIAEAANEIGRTSTRKGAPPLTEKSSFDDLLRWLRWNDPNGEYESAEAARRVARSSCSECGDTIKAYLPTRTGEEHRSGFRHVDSRADADHDASPGRGDDADGIETESEAWDLVNNMVGYDEPAESDAAARGRLLELNPRAPKKVLSEQRMVALIRWDKEVSEHAFAAITKKYPGEKIPKTPILSRLGKLNGFLNSWWGDRRGTLHGIHPAPLFDPEDAAALILWPRRDALRLAKKLFPLTAEDRSIDAAREADLLEQLMERINTDWFKYPLSDEGPGRVLEPHEPSWLREHDKERAAENPRRKGSRTEEPRRRAPTPPSPAAMIEDLVRKAVIKVFKITPEQAEKCIKSSFLTTGHTGGNASPFKVVVYSEFGYVPDPYHYDLTREYDKVVKEIQKDKLAVADAGWDSYNAAVQFFWIEPRLVS